MRIEVSAQEAVYRLLEGSPLKVLQHGEEISLSMDGVVTRPIPDIQIKVGPRPSQPPGREPIAKEAKREATEKL